MRYFDFEIAFRKAWFEGIENARKTLESNKFVGAEFWVTDCGDNHYAWSQFFYNEDYRSVEDTWCCADVTIVSKYYCKEIEEKISEVLGMPYDHSGESLCFWRIEDIHHEQIDEVVGMINQANAIVAEYISKPLAKSKDEVQKHLDSLVGLRLTKRELEKNLTEFFNVPITLKDSTVTDCFDVDYSFIGTTEQGDGAEHYVDFEVYVLKCRDRKTYLITEVDILEYVG